MINHWMFKCKDVSHLISRSMDQKLPLRIRFGIKLHLMMCNLCSRYKNQLDLIRKAILKIDADQKNKISTAQLPDHIKKKINDDLKTH